MNKCILLIIAIAFCSVSCNDWLDVRPGTEMKEDDQFSSERGFYDALTGCYMSMASRDIYGERLSITNIESLANLWEITANSNDRREDRDLMLHDYTTDYSKEAINKIYTGLFYTIAQANMIIKYADEQGNVFADEAICKMVQGEAYAIRAYCQFDVLRLFGQLPENALRQVALPYSYTTGIDEMPAYYGFDAYVELLKEDLKAAESLLKDNDPLFEYTFKELDVSDFPSSSSGPLVADDHLLYRRSRLNYWAVKALQSRVHLYLGETTEAYRMAKEIIDGKGADGAPVMTMSGKEDFAKGYKLCPNECLFYISKYDIMDYTVPYLIGEATGESHNSTRLMISDNRLAELYQGENTATHNRFNKCWRQGIRSASDSKNYSAVTKYYHQQGIWDLALYYQVIPMLRMSEVYLIAMEAS